jgi:endonuclease YncB( thermonuclease family)
VLLILVKSTSYVLIWLLLLCMPPAFAAANSLATVVAGRVVRVVDGDTLDVLLGSGRIRVRLHGIDAPERDQAGGAVAAHWLARQLLNQQVELEPVSQDQYSRMVAVVHAAGRNINRELVRNGHAWAYRRYLRRADRELCSLEHQARRAHTGMWAATASHAPWEYRATAGKGPFTDFSRTTAEDCRKAMRRR